MRKFTKTIVVAVVAVAVSVFLLVGSAGAATKPTAAQRRTAIAKVTSVYGTCLVVLGLDATRPTSVHFTPKGALIVTVSRAPVANFVVDTNFRQLLPFAADNRTSATLALARAVGGACPAG